MRIPWVKLIPPMEREEAPLVGSLCLLHFLVICAFTLARVARDALLLSRLPVQYLPYITLGLALWTAVTAFAFGRFTSGTATHRALGWALGGTGASLLLFLLWFRASDETAAVAFYAWTGAYGPLLVAEFWSLANERVNPRQARRLFGMIGAGGILGGVAGGTAGTLLGRAVAPQFLLVLVAALHFLAVFVALKSGVRDWEAAPARTVAEPQDRGTAGALRRPYVRLLVLLFLAGGLCSAVLEYEFKLAVQQQAADARQITSLVGAFYGLQSLLALGVQIGLAGFILSRFGARTASTVLPSGIFAGSLLTLGWPAFVPVMATRLYDSTLRISMARTAWEFLFFPLPDEIRRPAKRFIDGVVSRSAEAAAGLLILGLNATLGGSVAELAGLTAILAAVWVGSEILVSRSYAKEMSGSLERMLSDGRPKPVSLAEAGATAELIQLLASPDDRAVLYALELLQSAAPDAIRERATELMHHPSAAVRVRALTLPALRGATRAPGTPEPHEVGDDSLGAALGALTPSPIRRPPRSEEAHQAILALFTDPEADVRLSAYRSAALSGDRQFVPLLIDRLGSPEDRRGAREALVAYGDRVTGTLGDSLIDSAVPAHVRREIPRVLGSIGTQDAAYSLLRGAYLKEDRGVVHEVLRALNRIRSHGEIAPPAALVGRHIRTEVELYLKLLLQRAAVRHMPEGPAQKLLLRVLGEWIEGSLELIFRRLALVYPTRDVLLAHRGIVSTNARLRAQSLEVLETILSPEHKGLVLPLIEEAPLREKERRAALLLDIPRPSLRRTLLELVESEDRWLKSCALYAIGTLKLSGMEDRIQHAIGSTDPTVQEMASWANEQLAVVS